MVVPRPIEDPRRVVPRVVRSKRGQNVHMRGASSGHLSRSRAAQARLPRPIRDPPPCWRGHESHRPALELLRATVRGAPDVRGAVHPPTALVCWQVRGARRVPKAAILRHHRGGARHGPPGRSVDETGGAPTTRTRLLSTAQPDHRLHSMRGRRLSGAAMEAALDGYSRALSLRNQPLENQRWKCACFLSSY